MILYYLNNYKNYYNRLAHRTNDLNEYLGYLITTQNDSHFRPGDGISAEAVINYSRNENPNFVPDYLVVWDDYNQKIASRWYVIEAFRTAKWQYKVELYRDVIADWWAEIVEAPVFLEKGWVAADDPAIFNSESLTFNQIKTRETLLKDESGIPWIVGYYAKDATDITGSVPVNDMSDLGHIQLTTSIDAWEYSQYTAETPFISPYTNAVIGIKARQNDGISGTQIKILLDSETVSSEKSNQYNRETLTMNQQISMVNWV